ncbi:hypothetical protein FA11_1529 [Pelosinus fermentans A11]|uniref:Uncharacterized protein n=1 Tax=Pelosinus fermentans B4 TaxID=1149862 RepID=I9L5Z0_9FIRM|nr:hypothetical protein FB4_1473 [Pelosinus fermentans B4]EIW27510.1 hypothetical protein FA11_1529 [Pelosinus fermentans A11]
MYLLTSFPEIVAADKSKKTFGISLIAFNSIITTENGLEKFQPILVAQRTSSRSTVFIMLRAFNRNA